jgi:signal transduction histidine kinase
VNIDDVAREAAAQFQSRTPARTLDLRVASGAIIQADALWWRDVLLELLQNAHEAAPAESPIVLAIVRVNDEVVASVIDRGPGFDASVISHAGEPLVSAKAGVRGAGMGLAIVSAFCGAVGGTLGQTHEDGQTTVSLRLPTE